MSRDDIFARAMDLPVAERRTLALELLESTEDTGQATELDPDIEAAWYAEIQRRRRDLEAGTVELIPWEQVRAELFADD